MKYGKKLVGITLATSFLLMPFQVYALEKRETVYSNLEYSGKTYQTVVSNHLSRLENGSVLDETELKNILNINGDEKYTLDNKGLLWESTGKDIYYQGESEASLPIETTITYYLNGEKIAPEDLVGKSGSVKVVFKFKNNEEHMVKINGKNEKLYTPFVTMIGTLLEGEDNSSVTVSSGKVISTGNRHMIVGIASPGMYESLGLKELESLNEFTLSFETTKFSLNNVYMVSTPKILEESDLGVFDKMDSMYQDIYLLQKNMDVLESGVKELVTGASTLNVGSKELMDGLSKVLTVMNQLKTGAVSIDTGMKQVVTALNEVSKELETLDFADSVKQLNYLKSKNSEGSKGILLKTGMSYEEVQALYLKYNLQNYTGDDENLVSLKSAYELASLLYANNKAIDETLNTLTGMENKINQLLDGLTKNFATLSAGATKLSTGLGEVETGLNKVYNGSKVLNQGTNSLTSGASLLSEGATKFNNEGIKKLVRYANTLKNYGNKFEALVTLSREYQGFSSNNSNETLFVSMTKSLKTCCVDKTDVD